MIRMEECRGKSENLPEMVDEEGQLINSKMQRYYVFPY